MIGRNLSISLPPPWVSGTFEANDIGPINFLVGPNGSGQSQLAKELARNIKGARLLGTDRLSGMEQVRPFARLFGDNFHDGLHKSHFDNFKRDDTAISGISTLVLLEERIDLRIQVEAVLGKLFNRDIMLTWDSGNLIPKARVHSRSDEYRLDRDECHGIKELCVLLTHLYDEKLPALFIDEPELNLHPQYQAFFMHEVRKVAGDPAEDSRKKLLFLITHSPFILDFRSVDDLKSVISFSLDYSNPRRWSTLNGDAASTASLVRRLNSHQKQLFFADNPIFVEGILDAQMVTALMEARGVAVEAAGSCIIDAGGSEEVNHYFQLCRSLGKNAHFLYDLDNLFRGRLRSCIKDDETVQGLLATAGMGNDFAKYCGELDRKLTDVVDQVLATTLPDELLTLGCHLRGLGNREAWNKAEWSQARTAVLTAVSLHRDAMASVVPPADMTDVEGRLNQIVGLLEKINIHLLPGGTLERYIPSYQGDRYQFNDKVKQEAVQAEIEFLASPHADEELADRYGDLYSAVCRLPASPDVDVEPVVRSYLSDYIHNLQKAVVANPEWQHEEIQNHLNVSEPAIASVFSIRNFVRTGAKEFQAMVEVSETLGLHKRIVHADDKTNASMGEFVLESD